jgi:hypothetical protein
MVVGTANGKLWVGLGGEKGTDSRAGKKVRKWNGLVGDAALELALVDGPVVGVSVDPFSVSKYTSDPQTGPSFRQAR